MHIPSFWGKADSDSSWHPAICHMLDVGRVAEVLLESVLPADVLALLSAPVCEAGSSASAVLAFLSALHDLGKVSPGFQKKRRDLFQAPCEGLGFSIADESDHGAVTSEACVGLLNEWGLGADASENLARALGGHHGSFPSLMSKSCGKGPWDGARRETAAELAHVFGIDLADLTLDAAAVTPAWLLTLAGFLSVCDWIGSDERYFPYVGHAGVDIDAYATEARDKAARAFKEIGWSIIPAGGEPSAFGDLFFDTVADGARQAWSPNAMQSACYELAEAAGGPFLLLVEAPTGSGKTEAALWSAETDASRRGAHGLYYALPTQATSNQMLERLLAFLRGRFPGNRVPLHLLHGMASMNKTFKKLPGDGSAHDEGTPAPTNVEQDEGAVVAQEWFCGRKRGLLSPFAVGTVDQALLAALTTRHFFVRVFGLAQKTVVIDEVHAYDTYMSTLLDRLLEWLSAVGSSVILLSATLPARRRRELVRAYTGADTAEPSPPYPRVVVGSRGRVEAEHVPFEKNEERVVKISACPDEPEKVARLLSERLEGGGCAAWICNTVGRAQEAYCTLRDDGRFADADLILFHARYPVEDRLHRERAVPSKFGKKGDRPEKAVVVATQVIEQSLDLDFDFMVTDLAPVDLMLQRAGRLHRHPARSRPAGLAQPQVIWRCPGEGEDGVPAFGVSGFIYDSYVLLRTWLLLRGRDRMTLPADTEALIEAVYGEVDALDGQAAPVQDAMERLRKASKRKRDSDASKARQFIVPRPGRSDWFDGTHMFPDEDDAARGLTRLARPTITVICVHETDNGLSLTPDGSEPIDLDTKPDRPTTARLLERSVRLSLRHWYEHFKSQQPPRAWREVPLLRSCVPAVFRDGELAAGGRRLILDEELGLYDAPETP